MYGTAAASTCHVASASGANTTVANSWAAAPAPSGSPARAMSTFQPACSAAAARASARASAGTPAELPDERQDRVDVPGHGGAGHGPGRQLDGEGGAAREVVVLPSRGRPARVRVQIRAQPHHVRVPAGGCP